MRLQKLGTQKPSFGHLNIFIHQSIRCIIGINMIQVKGEKISDEKLRVKFYNILAARRLIVVKQLNFNEKSWEGKNLSFQKILLTAWVNHTLKIGGVLTTTKMSMVKALQLLYPTTKFHTDKDGEQHKGVERSQKNLHGPLWISTMLA